MRLFRIQSLKILQVTLIWMLLCKNVLTNGSNKNESLTWYIKYIKKKRFYQYSVLLCNIYRLNCQYTGHYVKQETGKGLNLELNLLQNVAWLVHTFLHNNVHIGYLSCPQFTRHFTSTILLQFFSYTPIS